MKYIYCLPEIDHPGGIGRITAIKANYLASQGHDIYIVTTDQEKEVSFYELHPRIKIINLRLFFNRKTGNVFMDVYKKVRKSSMCKRSLCDLINKIHPDFVITTIFNGTENIVKLKDKSKKIFEFHFSYNSDLISLQYFKKPWYMTLYCRINHYLRDLIIKKFDAFVVLTKEDYDLWPAFQNKVIIPNMIPNLSDELSSQENKIVVGVGRLDGQKNFPALIEIWRYVHEKAPDWTLQIYGQGPQKQLLLDKIESYGLSDSVFINEPTKNIGKVYKNASIFALSSTYEGFGLVLIEAMNYGLPCVAYACQCGPKDIIQNDYNGFVIEENDQVEYVNRLLELINSREKRMIMGKNAHESIYKFTPPKVMEEWLALFKKLS